ncbi:MAG: glycosyltransferase family 39 protein, partial [Pedosphaera parvula]|nr:glycosyltransferase family 39 protein [Pedosphaera parvula]
MDCLTQYGCYLRMTENPNASASRGLFSKPWWIAFSLLAILAVVAGIRLRLLNLPLERDEGEYAYAGQLLLQGVAPYDQAYNMKFPGTYAAYALIMAVFGQTAAGIHAGLLLVNLATAALVFFMTRRLTGAPAAVAAAGTYALLSISPPMLGLAAHATHFVVLPALGGIFLLQQLDGQTSRARILSAGVLLGIAILMKQSGALFGLFAAGWITWFEIRAENRNWRRLGSRLGLLALGGLLPLALTCVLLGAAGVLDRFWLWAFKYAGAYASIVTPAQAWALFRLMAVDLFKAAPGLWTAVLAGLVLLFCEPSTRRAWPFVAGFACFSFMAVCPGWYFREHYFLLFLPAAGLLAGVAMRAGARTRNQVHLEGLLSYRPTPGTVFFLGYGSQGRTDDAYK